MYPDIAKLKELLVNQNYITKEESQAAEAASENSLEYIDYLINKENLSKTLLGQALAESYSVPYTDITLHPISQEELKVIPLEIAHTNRVIPVSLQSDKITLATDSPKKVNLEQLQEQLKGLTIHLTYALPESIDEVLTLYAPPLATRFSQIIAGEKRIAPEIFEEIINDALTFHASDIHFEPQEADVLVRFRIDGSLRDAGHLSKENYENVLNKIKVESGMRIDEHFAAQDGSIRRISKTGRPIDLRVSLVPTVLGEKVVMRILGSYVQGFTLGDIGLDDTLRKLLETYATKPFGMILNVGPTGSGKTTTLYSVIKLLNRPDVNITSIEDPVEYKISGINQIQVREKTNLTFAKGLRSIIRQDPNVILVGEIRDQETAEIAVNAALTGHILLSTFHANDAATAIPRLIELGVEPFLLASTLELLIAQRLVRTICSNCRFSLPATEALASLKEGPSISTYFSKGDTVYAGKGCKICSGTGYLGRTAIFEMIEITDEMEDLILKSPTNREVSNLAIKQGSLTMFDDGIKKVKSGKTTIAEVLRVVAPPHEGHEKEK